MERTTHSEAPRRRGVSKPVYLKHKTVKERRVHAPVSGGTQSIRVGICHGPC